MDKASLKDKLAHLPVDPGVYMMKNTKGEIIYVGKAKSLKNRVRSYFTSINSKDLKTKILVNAVCDFDIILTKNEVEALLLERTLIRHHHPIYNVMLKDGKEYPYVRVDFNEPWPRIEKVRRRKSDGAFYLGPYSSAGFLGTTMKLMGRVFPLIRCSRHEFKSAKRPCNYYHMKMCLGPCTLPVEREHYLTMLRGALSLLTGSSKDLARELKVRMNEASEKEQYEQAAQFRDQLHALTEITRPQSAVVKTVDDADVLGICLKNEMAAFHVLMVREGKVIGGENFLAASPIQTEAEAMQEFLLQYYDQRLPPPELIVPFEMEDGEELLHALGPRELAEISDAKRKFTVPQRGPRADLVAMATKNANYHYEEWDRENTKGAVAIKLLKDFLKLATPPKRIECIDISNTGGSGVVASAVCFVDAKPAKEFYRHYLIKDLPEGKQDDFASIEEVVRRRLRRGLEDGDMPDLLVIDGGKGQLNAALKSLKEFPQARVPIISLAKSRLDKNSPSIDPKHSYERVFIPAEENSIPLKPGSAIYRLLTHLRDEAHRFAITHHRKKRAAKFHSSELDEIAGIGPKLRQKLLEKFNGLEGIKQASLDQLLLVQGLKESVALAIHSKFRD